jgi:uncharacterized tellurite resistance protein B-like protein
MKKNDITKLHLIAFMYLTLADIDNDPKDKELSLAVSLLNEWGVEDKIAADKIIKESFEWYMSARDQNKVGSEIETNLHVFDGFNEDHRKAILNDMIKIIKADGNIDPKETKFFGAIAGCLGIDLG